MKDKIVLQLRSFVINVYSVDLAKIFITHRTIMKKALRWWILNTDRTYNFTSTDKSTNDTTFVQIRC